MSDFTLLEDERGPFLTLSPAEALAVTTALAEAGVPFSEDDGVGAGCAGPEVIVLRFPGDRGRSGLRETLDDALGAL